MPYFEFRNFSVDFDESSRKLRCYTSIPDGKLHCFFETDRFTVSGADGKALKSSFPNVTCQTCPDTLFTAPHDDLSWVMKIIFGGKTKKAASFEITVSLRGDHLEISSPSSVRICGIVKNESSAAHPACLMSSKSDSGTLFGAVGPADFPGADLLYNRETDQAVQFTGKTAVRYDWTQKNYLLTAEVQKNSPLVFRFKEHVCQTLFHTKYWKTISTDHGFTTPPVGWMTWYAVRFDACEKVVLENARKMKEHFSEYSDKICIWVDWEWCHKALDGLGEPGVDVLHPRKDAYPHGLKYVSERIRKMGLIPALWTGATNDGDLNEMLREHPEYLLSDLRNWAGHFWVDLSHPGMIEEYIPRIFRQLLAWGYKVIKWDCLANSLRVNDEFRAKRFDPDLSSEEAMHRLVVKAREIIGSKVFLLGCTIQERGVLFANDIFDACRIGGDVFNWDEFKENAVSKIFGCFPIHNMGIFLDPDTLVLREEYSTLEQARTRITLFSLTGIQLTVGDPVAELDDARIDALKRAMPVVEVKPAEMIRKIVSGDVASTNLAVERPFGRWYISGFYNMTGRKKKVKVHLKKDLHLPAGEYAIFEFWNKKFLGVTDQTISLELPPGGCAAIRLTPLGEEPVLAGSTRHLMQGAAELKNYHCDCRKGVMTGTLDVVRNDPVELYFYATEGFIFQPQQGLEIEGNLAKLTILSSQTGSISWQIKFRKK